MIDAFDECFEGLMGLADGASARWDHCTVVAGPLSRSALNLQNATAELRAPASNAA